MSTNTHHSSRHGALVDTFLKPALRGARHYDRISGYFTSSLFELLSEDFEGARKVQLVCNSDLKTEDILAARTAERQRQAWRRAMPGAMQAATPGVPLGTQSHTFLQGRLQVLAQALRSGTLEVKVLPDHVFGMVHGKAGVITREGGNQVAFIGSANDTAPGWSGNYELLWSSEAQDTIAWTQAEFDALWNHEQAIPLAEVIIQEIEHLAGREEIDLGTWRRDIEADPGGVATLSPILQSPVYTDEDGLWDHQRLFVQQVMRAHLTQGRARLLLADQVGLGKTLQLAVSAQLIALHDEQGGLIIAPKAVTAQWQDELWTRLRLPIARWQGGRWRGELGQNLEGALGQCPYRIGIISSELFMTQRADSPLFANEYSVVVVDEAHRARRSNHGAPDKAPDFNLLGRNILRIGHRTKSLLLATATPLQLHLIEGHDQLTLLSSGAEEISGGPLSRWNREALLGLEMLSELKPWPGELPEAWQWLRRPLPPVWGPHGERDDDARFIRDTLDLPVRSVEAAADDYMNPAPGLRQAIRENRERWLENANPYVRSIVMRTRESLEDAGKLKKIGVILHSDAVQVDTDISTAYAMAEDFCRELKDRQGLSGFAKVHLLRRLSSSLEAGLITARRLLDGAPESPAYLGQERRAAPRPVTDTQNDEARDRADSENDTLMTIKLTQGMRDTLHSFIALLDIYNRGKRDPKFSMILHQLRSGWLEKGCIIFSQYLDTARAAARFLSHEFPEERIALYSNEASSGYYLGGLFTPEKREQLKIMVRTDEIRLVIGTDAASEGLNLQSLSTLINIDLPWNPTRLEQRKGRIQRPGQREDHIHVYNMRYAGSIEDRVHERLSERLQSISNLFGLIPETLNDIWIEEALRDRTNAATTDQAQDSLIEQAQRIATSNPFKRASEVEAKIEDWQKCTRVLKEKDSQEWLRKGWIY